MSFGASTLHAWEPPASAMVGPAREVLIFAATSGTTPEALSVAGAAVKEARPVYIRLQRTWRHRLFSLPWRPWQKFVGPAIPMKVSTDDGLTYRLEQIGGAP